jgi:hypothetical protein
MQEGMQYRDQLDRQMVNSIKEEILADLKAQKEEERRYERRSGNYLREDRSRNSGFQYSDDNVVREEILKELRAVEEIEKRLARRSNPHTAGLVRELLEEAREKGMTVSELIQAMSGRKPNLRNRLSDMLFNSQRFPLGVGAVLLGLLLIPAARGGLRPLARKIVEEFINMSEKTQTVIARAQEDLSDIVAEAQFARLADSAQQATENNIPEGLSKDSEVH